MRSGGIKLPRPTRPYTGRVGHDSGAAALTRAALRWARCAEWAGLETLTERSWRLFASTDSYDAWLIAWPAGGAIDLHDHGGSSGTIVVVSGCLTETRAEPDGAGGHELQRRRLVAGGLPASFDGDEVHDVSNVGETPALSLHVYSPRLTSMTFYELVGNELFALREESCEGVPEALAQ
jgi:hypothetical protein